MAIHKKVTLLLLEALVRGIKTSGIMKHKYSDITVMPQHVN